MTQLRYRHGAAHRDASGEPRIHRRAILKASAAFAAMAAAPAVRRPVTARAEERGTLAGEWIQPANVGSSDESLGFVADFPFRAIAPHWSGETGSPLAVELQLSADGETFSDPVLIGPAHTDAGPVGRDGRTFGALTFTEGATYVRYRGIDDSGSGVAIPDLSFTYIDATGGPTLGDITPTSPAPSLMRPPIISREEWGASLAYGGADRGEVEWTPEYQTVAHVIIHHSETPSFRDPLAEIRSIHYYHAITRGWGDIGYNYLVDFMGNVYEGRSGGENVVGGHAYRYAYGSAGICVMGSFSLETSTPEAVAGLTWISAWAARDLDVLGQSDFHERPNLPTICGHRDVNDSTCPGDGLYADLPLIRKAVAEVIGNGGDVVQDPEFSPGQIVTTMVEGANVREKPGTRTTISAALSFGTLLQIIDGPTSVDGEVWYQVSADATWGWIASSLIDLSDEPPVGKYAAGDKLLINTDVINIRAEPSLRGAVVASVPSGEDAVVVEGPNPAGGYRWYKVTTADAEGWAAEQYLIHPDELQPESRFLTGDSVVAGGDGDGLNLRSEASTGTGVVASLPVGTPGIVVEGPVLSDRLTWLRVRTASGTGWCVESYLEQSPTPVHVASGLRKGDIVRVDTDALNLRDRPGVNEVTLVTLGAGSVGTVVGGPRERDNLTWLQLDTDLGRGWGVDLFLARTDAAPVRRTPVVGEAVYVDTDGVNLRDRPSVDGEVNVILLRQETGTVVGGPRDADGQIWLEVESGRGTGWAASRYLAVGTADPSGSTTVAVGDEVGVSTDGINVRSNPSLSSDVIRIVLAGEVVPVVDGPRQAEGYVWFKLSTDRGDGWAIDRYLRTEASAALGKGDTARVVDGEVNLRTDPGVGAGVVGILADGAYVEILDGPEQADGYDWMRVQSSRFGSGWAARDYLARQ